VWWAFSDLFERQFQSRQVDFIIFTERRFAHLELKHFLGPIEGREVGPWYTLSGTGSQIARIPLEGQWRRENLSMNTLTKCEQRSRFDNHKPIQIGKL
jgi:hypothetical protein